MTAEIAILNKSGIALAADSAVTIGSEKVYNSANKLFTLSKYQPVGIMIYDSADLLSVPWEIIIKEYRRTLADTTFNTLQEYADHFWDFIKNDTKFFPDYIQEQYIIFQAFNYLDKTFNRLKEKTTQRLINNEKTTINISLQDLKEISLQDLKSLEDVEFIPGFTSEDVSILINKYINNLKECASNVLGELYHLLEEDDSRIIFEVIINNLVKHIFNLRTTGVVIAGYGKNEVYPKIASYYVEGVINKKIKKIFIEGKSNTQTEFFATTIIPFAQDEMVWTFLSGIDPNIQKFSMEYLHEVFSKYSDSLTSDVLNVSSETLSKIQEQLKSEVRLILTEFQQSTMKFQRSNNIQPILDMVEVLPKDELSAMAESLVNLTVFKRKVSKSVETVGGPIDVAIISKGDGFIWSKRKHYFDPKLNQHFFSNYFRQDC